MRLDRVIVIPSIQKHLAPIRAPSLPVSHRIEAGILPQLLVHMNPVHDTVVGGLFELRRALSGTSDMQGMSLYVRLMNNT